MQNRKLENLKREYLASGIDPDKVIFNCSTYSLNPVEKKVLSRGLKFSIRPDKLDYCEFLTPFEKLARSLKNRPIANDGINFDFVKTQLKGIALSAYYGYDSSQFPLNISKAELSALKKLCRNKDLVILRPDKGNGLVILNRVDYIKKVESLLSDASKFKKLDIDMLDLCLKRENKLIRFLRDKLLKQKSITNDVYKDLFQSGSTPGILYGLPKVHKINCPARPILSAIGTYNYKLAKFLVPILQPYTINEYVVKDSFSFVSEISSFTTDEQLVMASFDVSSLFTNIPLDETIDLCTDLVFHDNGKLKYRDCALNRSQFRKLLGFAVKENHFIFNGQLFDQIDGVAMGSPLGPSLANVFMSELEQRFLSNCPPECKPVLYRRYVDDTFCLFRNRDHIALFLNFINSQHPNIKFTYETETENSLPFLDVLVTREGNCFTTSLFRKKTFTGLYTDFSSLAPDKYKKNLISVLLYRAFHICSTYKTFHDEIIRIKEILSKNKFPRALVDRIIKSFLDKTFTPTVVAPTETETRVPLLFCIPFLGRYSLQMKTRICRLVKKCYPGIQLKVIFRSSTRIQSFFPFKDRIPSLIRSSVIYKFQCPGCHAWYYGKTSRNLITRCREHLGINKAGQQKIKVTASAIWDHLNESGHTASLDDFSILDRANNDFDLLIHESLLILRDRPSLNSQQSSIPLALF